MIEVMWKEIRAFNDKWFSGWRTRENITDYSNALAGETGEVCNATKKLKGWGTNKKTALSDNEVLYELIDVFIYSVLLFDCLVNTRKVDSPEQFKFLFDRKMEELERRMEENQTLATSMRNPK